MTDTIWHPDISQFPGPKYLALTRALREAVRTGMLPEGSQLPTVRDLAWRLQLTPGTVARAYQLATQEGMLAATVGRGTFVAARSPKLGPTQALYLDRDKTGTDAHLVDLRAPQLPDVGQVAALSAAMIKVAERLGQDWIDYPSQRNELALREAVVGWLGDRILGPFGADDIALTHGGQSAISLILLCCLRGDRPVVLTEELSYPGFRHAARLARADVVGIETDQHGMIPHALELACQRHGAQIICLTTEAQNPTTARMPPDRRAQIVEIARRFDLQIIDDDCYALAKSNWPSMRAMAPERTWQVGSLSKTVSAALRFGYIVCPHGMGPTGRLTAQHSFFALARPVSELCLELLTSGAADAIRAATYDELEGRLKATVNALGGFDLAWQPGVRFVYLTLPSGWRGTSFTRAAEAAGVLVRSADEYALIHARAPCAVRLAMAGNIPRGQFDAGIAKLAHLLLHPPTEISV